MTFNRRVDRIESGPNNPKAPNNEVIWIDTEENTINRYNESNSSWVSVGGSGGNANIADFVFDYNEDDGYVSSMTIANHDMVIETTRTESQDADISITSADDIWITAGDEIEIDAEDTIDIRSDTEHVRIVSDRTNSNNEWTFETNGGLRFPDSTVQTTAYTGGGSASFTVPTAFKDSDGDDLITFEITNTGTARIGTPQDDLSLRSARDITLFAGDDGPGNVYIGWGDATYTPDSPNRVATIGDINDNHGDFEFNNAIISTEDVTMKIQSKRDSSTQGSAIELDPYDGQVSLFGYSSINNTSYSTSDWASADWSSWGDQGSQVVLTGATELITFLGGTFGSAPFQSISVNGSDFYTYNGGSSGDGGATIYLSGGSPGSTTTVTSLEFRYQTVSRIEIDDDDEEILIEGKGLNVKLRSTGNISFKSSLDEDSEYNWEMANNGKFQLPGDGYIENVVNGSGDDSGNDTIKIVPDSNCEDTDQYLIIDPTFGSPSHIHIRAGGQQDNSSADLILGAERTNVRVSDTDGEVFVSSKRPDTINTYENINTQSDAVFVISGDLSSIIPNSNFSVEVEGTLFLITSVDYLSGPDTTEITATGVTFEANGSYAIHESNYENYWSFTENGYLSGPAMGGLFVSGILNADNDLWISSGSNVVISSGDGMGVFLENQDEPDNQVVTIGDLNASKGTYSRVLASDGSPLTGALVHVGKLLYANLTETSASFLIPTNAAVAFPIGSEIKFATSDESPWHISAVDYEVTTVWGEGSTYTWSNQTPFIVPTNSTATLLKVDTDRWILSSIRLTD